MVTRRELVATIERLVAEFTIWVTDREIGDTLAMTAAIDDALLSWGDDVTGGTETAHKLVDRLSRMVIPAEELLAEDSPILALADWLRDQQHEPQRKVIETVEEFERQGLTPRQICIAYGWMDGNIPQVEKIAEEKQSTGKHTSEHPAEKARQKREADRDDALAMLRTAVVRRREQCSRRPAETVAELVGQGVYGRQICEMHRISREQFEAECQQAQLTIPAWDYGSVARARSVYEPAVPQEVLLAIDAAVENPVMGRAAAETEVEIHAAEDVSLSVDEEILARLDLGQDKDTIYSEMNEGYAKPQVSRQKISAVIRCAAKTGQWAEGATSTVKDALKE